MSHNDKKGKYLVCRCYCPSWRKLVQINLADAAERATLLERAPALPQITVGSRQLADLEMLAEGAFSPVTGFYDAERLSECRQIHAPEQWPSLVYSGYACCN